MELKIAWLQKCNKPCKPFLSFVILFELLIGVGEWSVFPGDKAGVDCRNQEATVKGFSSSSIQFQCRISSYTQRPKPSQVARRRRFFVPGELTDLCV